MMRISGALSGITLIVFSSGLDLRPRASVSSRYQVLGVVTVIRPLKEVSSTRCKACELPSEKRITAVSTGMFVPRERITSVCL